MPNAIDVVVAAISLRIPDSDLAMDMADDILQALEINGFQVILSPPRVEPLFRTGPA